MATDPIPASPDEATDDDALTPVAPAAFTSGARRAPGPRPEQMSQTDRLWMLWETKRRTILTVVGALLLAALAVALFAWWRAGQNAEATDKLADSVALFEAGQFEQALRTDGTRTGLKDLADNYGSTKAGNLARYYTAASLYELKRYDEAKTYFEAFDGSGTVLGPAADVALAAILENQNKPAEAAAAYVEAADAAKSPLFTPMYLLSAARAYLAANDAAGARRVLERIKSDYADAPEAQEVEFLLGQADAKAPAAPAR